MLFGEWKMEDAIKVWRAEGVEDGIEMGREENAKNLRDYGMSPDQIAGALKLPLDTVLHYLES
jgi:hypothetical protein